VCYWHRVSHLRIFQSSYGVPKWQALENLVFLVVWSVYKPALGWQKTAKVYLCWIVYNRVVVLAPIETTTNILGADLRGWVQVIPLQRSVVVSFDEVGIPYIVIPPEIRPPPLSCPPSCVRQSPLIELPSLATPRPCSMLRHLATAVYPDTLGNQGIPPYRHRTNIRKPARQNLRVQPLPTLLIVWTPTIWYPFISWKPSISVSIRCKRNIPKHRV
jgi:hypothetical protein